jgi:hypothetical protein
MRRTRNRPFVIATFAMTADGKVTDEKFGAVDFTSREDKLHLFRSALWPDCGLCWATPVWNGDNVRLGVPAELQESEIKARSVSLPASRNRLEQRQKSIVD